MYNRIEMDIPGRRSDIPSNNESLDDFQFFT